MCGVRTNLQSSPLCLFSLQPSPQGELLDEDTGCLGEQNWDLGTDHLQYRVRGSVVARIKMKNGTFMYVWNIIEGYNI